MGCPCKFHGCTKRATGFARRPLGVYVPDSATTCHEQRAHPFCQFHLELVEDRLEDMYYAGVFR